MTPLHDIATIGHMLQFLKERVPPHRWAETPLPVIAAPGAWMTAVAESLGARAEDGGPVEPETIHGCSVVRKDELDAPVLVDHDGKVYPIQTGWAATASGPQAPSPVTVQ